MCQLLRLGVTLFDQVKIPLRRFHASPRFLLKGMQHINPLADLNRQNDTVRVRPISQSDFQNAAADALERLGVFGMPPNWISCNSSPSSFCAPFGKLRMFTFEFPSQITALGTGGLKPCKIAPPEYIVNLL